MTHDWPGLIRYLQDAHALETAALEALDAFNPGFATIEATEAVTRYKLIVEDQIRTVSQRLAALGSRQSPTKGFMSVIFGKANDLMNANTGGEDRTTQLFIRYYGSAQTKGAMYEAIFAYATELGDPETAKFASTHRNQEFEWAMALFPFIAESLKDNPKERFAEFES